MNPSLRRRSICIAETIWSNLCYFGYLIGVGEKQNGDRVSFGYMYNRVMKICQVDSRRI